MIKINEWLVEAGVGKNNWGQMKIKLPDLASALASWAKLAYPFEQLGSDENYSF
jgi:hypothetical protein